eukprot:scaffold28098_cov41-Prasinocladus_malaysianus.AAC.1
MKLTTNSTTRTRYESRVISNTSTTTRMVSISTRTTNDYSTVFPYVPINHNYGSATRQVRSITNDENDEINHVVWWVLVRIRVRVRSISTPSVKPPPCYVCFASPRLPANASGQRHDGGQSPP